MSRESMLVRVTSLQDNFNKKNLKGKKEEEKLLQVDRNIESHYDPNPNPIKVFMRFEDLLLSYV